MGWAWAVPSESPTATVVMDIHKSVTAVFVPRVEIGSLIDLAKIGNDPAYPPADTLYVLTADIDASATAGWNDAGTDTELLEGFKSIGTSDNPFTGILDGEGHAVHDLVVNRPATDYVGLFGFVGLGGQVRNLGVVGGTITGHDSVGGLLGYSLSDRISDCYATGAVAGNECVGGLVGYKVSSTISNCCAACTVAGYRFVGGLAGYQAYDTVSNCYAAGTVTGASAVGGLVGYKYSGTVSDCWATGTVTGTSDRIGGLVGYQQNGTVSYCYAAGAVTGKSSVGGLIGAKDICTVSSSYWDTQTSGTSTSAGGTASPRPR